MIDTQSVSLLHSLIMLITWTESQLMEHIVSMAAEGDRQTVVRKEALTQKWPTYLWVVPLLFILAARR